MIYPFSRHLKLVIASGEADGVMLKNPRTCEQWNEREKDFRGSTLKPDWPV